LPGVFDYQRTERHFAQIAGELEADGAEELTELGARDVEPVRRGAFFLADRAVLYRVCYRSRLVGKVLTPLLSFDCPNPDLLYDQARSLDFGALLGAGDTFAVFANVSESTLTHSQYAALRLKDAIVDQFREREGRRPDVERIHPDVRFALHLHRDRATISLEATGGSLHRRGYRQASVAAPLQETLGAAIIRRTGWQGEQPLVDPFCGSGTLLAEALMQYCRVPGGYLRETFGFMRLPDFDRSVWQSERAAADAAIRPLPPGLISGSDLDPAAVRAARQNLDRLPGGTGVGLEVADFRRLAGFSGHTIVCNPPYGVRLGSPAEARTLFRELGDFLKERCQGCTAFLFVGDPELTKAVGLRPASRIPMVNGALRGRLCRFEIFAGSWRTRSDGR
jgi:putative N6-adenine-specific DNA methylase